MTEQYQPRWMSKPPERCDICKDSIETIFYDAATRRGPWGCLCPICFDLFGYGLGVGRGQEYRRQPDGTFLKTGGKLTMDWVIVNNLYPPEHLSIMDSMLSEANPLSAKEQLDAGYQQWGGWRPMQGFKMNFPRWTLLYPGDPPLSPWAITKLRNETILIYPGDWVVILQKNGSFEVCRMD